MFDYSDDDEYDDDETGGNTFLLCPACQSPLRLIAVRQDLDIPPHGRDTRLTFEEIIEDSKTVELRRNMATIEALAKSQGTMRDISPEDPVMLVRK